MTEGQHFMLGGFFIGVLVTAFFLMDNKDKCSHSSTKSVLKCEKCDDILDS
jgi:hypothetical protein